MKNIILALVLMSPLSVFAEDILNTKVNCTTTSNPQVFSEEAQQYKQAYIELQEYKLFPLMHEGNKSVLISKNGMQGTFAHLQLGPSASSSMFVSLPLANGEYQNCIVLVTKVKGEKPYIFEY